MHILWICFGVRNSLLLLLVMMMMFWRFDDDVDDDSRVSWFVCSWWWLWWRYFALLQRCRGWLFALAFDVIMSQLRQQTRKARTAWRHIDPNPLDGEIVKGTMLHSHELQVLCCFCLFVCVCVCVRERDRVGEVWENWLVTYCKDCFPSPPIWQVQNAAFSVHIASGRGGRVTQERAQLYKM